MLNEASENLKRGERRYRTIFEYSPEAIGILDVKGNILDMNERVYDWLGYRPKEIIGKNIIDVPYLTKESKNRVKEKFNQRISGKKIPPYDLDFITKSGERVVGRVLATAVVDKNKKTIGNIVMISNVTEQKQMEEKLRASEERLKNIINSSPDAITITDLNVNIIDCNQATLNLHGFSTKKELIGKNAFDFIAPKDFKKARKNIKKTLKQGFVKNVEYTLFARDGREFPVELSASVIRDSSGKPAFFMAIIKDISERKRIDKAKTEFVSLVSHQFRNPLTTINWYSEILLNQKVGKLSHQQKKYLKEIYTTNQQLVKLVNLFLNASKIELGTFGIKPEPINLTEIADIVINELLLQIKNKKLKIERKYDKNLPMINADSGIMRIVFQNLLSNAAKYSPRGGRMKLFVKKQKSNVLIKVLDRGYGIPKNQQSKIFTKFFRANNITEKEPYGTGLGLYVVKLVLEQSGGKIWFESREGKGTAFYVEIPLKGMKKRGKKLSI